MSRKRPFLIGPVKPRKSERGRHGKETTDQIVETPTEARQAERGPSVLALLTVSTGLAVMVFAGVWYVFFRT